jgi:hypothetical protein
VGAEVVGCALHFFQPRTAVGLEFIDLRVLGLTVISTRVAAPGPLVRVVFAVEANTQFRGRDRARASSEVG